MAQFNRITDYSLILNDQTPIVPQWLRKFPNSVFFQPGPVANYFYIQDLPSRTEYPTGFEGALKQIGMFYYGGESYVNLIDAITQSDGQLFVKLLLDDEKVDGKQNVVGAMLFRYVDHFQVAPINSWADNPDIEASIRIVVSSMVAQGLVTKNVVLPSKAASSELFIKRPDYMDFRA